MQDFKIQSWDFSNIVKLISELILKIHFRESLERRTYFSGVSHLSYFECQLKDIMGLKGIKMSSSDTEDYAIDLSNKEKEIPS